jgi:hypothetical protein
MFKGAFSLLKQISCNISWNNREANSKDKDQEENTGSFFSDFDTRWNREWLSDKVKF